MIKNVTLYTNKKIGFPKGFRIVQLNDFHYFSPDDTKLLEKIIFNIVELKPNYLIINGDMIQEADHYDHKLIYLLAKLSRVCQCLFIAGNHEFMTLQDGKWQFCSSDFIKELESVLSIRHINSTTFESQYLCFLGYELPFSWYEGPRDIESVMNDLRNKLQTFTDKTFNSLIVHDPEVMLMMLQYPEYHEVLKKIDLVLAAHTHSSLIPCYFDKTDKGIYQPEASISKYYMRGKTQTDFFDLYTGYALKTLPEQIPGKKIVETLYRPMMKVLKSFYPPVINVIDIKNRQ